MCPGDEVMPLSTNSVLVVEDYPQTVLELGFYLEKEGHSLVAVSTGEEALEVLSETEPSLVLLDIGLPGVDGFTTCQRIREVSEVPIIMVTGRESLEDKVRGLDMGADGYITKPFSRGELIGRVKSALRATSLST